MSHPRFMLGLLLALTVGCTPTVKDVCGSLDDSCSDFAYGACVEKGERIEQNAVNLGCGDRFDAYIDCASTVCGNWDEHCSAQREALEACVGAFP